MPHYLLLVLAGLLAETDVMNALELGLMQDMRIGEVLVGQGYISNEVLDAALELQRKVLRVAVRTSWSDNSGCACSCL